MGFEWDLNVDQLLSRWESTVTGKSPIKMEVFISKNGDLAN